MIEGYIFTFLSPSAMTTVKSREHIHLQTSLTLRLPAFGLLDKYMYATFSFLLPSQVIIGFLCLFHLSYNCWCTGIKGIDSSVFLVCITSYITPGQLYLCYFLFFGITITMVCFELHDKIQYHRISLRIDANTSFFFI